MLLEPIGTEPGAESDTGRVPEFPQQEQARIPRTL